MRINNNHLLLSFSGDTSGTFSHYDADGTLLEVITVPGGVPGVDIVAYAQWLNSTYLIAVDNNVFPVVSRIMEFDRDLNYVRTVFEGIDTADPLQNPTGASTLTAYFIGLDSDGNIYLDIDSSSVWLWKFDNNGNFLQLFTLADVHTSTPFTHLSIKTDDDCKLEHGVQGPNPTDLDGLLVYNVCNDVVDLEISTGDLTRPYVITGSNCNTALTYVLYRASATITPLNIYDSDFNVIQTIADFVSDAVQAILPQDNDEIVWGVEEASSTLGGTQIYQVDLATNTVILGPLVVFAANPSGNNLNAAYIWRRAPANCRGGIFPSGGWISSTLIGAN